MKINEECIRDIITYLSENLIIKKDYDDKYKYETISVYMLNKNFQSKYAIQDIIYSVKILNECGYIRGENLSKLHDIDIKFQDIQDITYLGNRFYESIQPETVWEKTKGIVGKIGNYSLEFIESTAKEVAVEMAKQAVSISMTGNSSPTIKRISYKKGELQA